MSKKVTFSRNLIRGGLGWLVGFLGVLLVEEVRSFIYPNNGARMEVRPLFENQFQPNFSDSNPSVPGSIPNSYSVKLSVYQSSVYLTVSIKPQKIKGKTENSKNSFFSYFHDSADFEPFEADLVSAISLITSIHLVLALIQSLDPLLHPKKVLEMRLQQTRKATLLPQRPHEIPLPTLRLGGRLLQTGRRRAVPRTKIPSLHRNRPAKRAKDRRHAHRPDPKHRNLVRKRASGRSYRTRENR